MLPLKSLRHLTVFHQITAFIWQIIALLQQITTLLLPYKRAPLILSLTLTLLQEEGSETLHGNLSQKY